MQFIQRVEIMCLSSLKDVELLFDFGTALMLKQNFKVDKTGSYKSHSFSQRKLLRVRFSHTKRFACQFSG